MGAPDLLNHLRRLGLSLSASGSELHVSPRAAITDEARELIRQHKVELLNALIDPAEMFSFSPPDDPANDADAVKERIALMVGSGMDEARARQEVRWALRRDQCWRAFLRNAEAVQKHPRHDWPELLARFRREAERHYGESTAMDMARSLAGWVNARRVH